MLYILADRTVAGVIPLEGTEAELLLLPPGARPLNTYSLTTS